MNKSGLKFGTQIVNYQPNFVEQSMSNSFGTNLNQVDISQMPDKTTLKNWAFPGTFENSRGMCSPYQPSKPQQRSPFNSKERHGTNLFKKLGDYVKNQGTTDPIKVILRHGPNDELNQSS